MENVLNRIKNFKLKSPEEAFKNIGQWFDTNKKKAFLVTLIIGFITHVVLLSIIIVSPDGLWNLLHFSAGKVETGLGRWAINIFDSLRKDFAIPTITTVFSIIITAITAVFIVDLLNLKSKTSIIVTGAFLAVSPCLTITLLYSYTADIYCLAFLFSVLAAWCIYREKHKVVGAIFGAVFTMLSLAIYQSYLGAIVGLCVVKPCLDILKSDKTYKQIFINIGASILIVLAGIIFYWIGEQIALNIYNTKLSTYRGANEVSILNTIRNLDESIKNTYVGFFEIFFGESIVNNRKFLRNTLYKVLFLIEGLALLELLIFRKADAKSKKIIDAILVIVMIAILPMAFNCIALITTSIKFYPLNTTQLILIIPFMMAILENFEANKGSIFKWISLIICLIICFTYYLSANITYLGIRMKYNQAYSMTVRMVDRIENCEEFKLENPWMIVGIIDEKNTTPVSDIYFYTLGGVSNSPIFHGNYIGSIETWKKFLQIFLGIQPNFASAEVYYKVCGTQEFKDMPIFPAQGSVREINGVMVVKLTHNVPM